MRERHLPGSASLTVVIPCYNAERYLAEAIESVLSQAPDGELIVVDDGSTDASVAVASGFGGRLTLVRQQNAGASAARNRGLAIARGSVVGFLDADDLFPAGSISRRLAVLGADEGVDAVAGLTQQFLSPDLPSSLRDRMGCPQAPVAGRLAGAMLLRRQVFDRVGLFDTRFRLGETMDWVARADAAGVRMAAIDDVVLHRRIHGANSVHKTAQLNAEYLRVLKASIDRRRGTAVDVGA